MAQDNQRSLDLLNSKVNALQHLLQLVYASNYKTNAQPVEAANRAAESMRQRLVGGKIAPNEQTAKLLLEGAMNEFFDGVISMLQKDQQNPEA